MGALSTRRSQRRASAEITLRRVLLLTAAAAAVTAVFAGLARLGVRTSFGPTYAGQHGPLFVVGVFGTVISLERAVAYGKRAALLAPALGALTAVALLTRSPWAPYAAAAASCGLLLLNALIVRRQSAIFTWLMCVGSGVFAFGNLAWALGRPIFEVVPSWVGFFVLTIVAERLELSRLSATPRWASRALAALALVYAGATCLRVLGYSEAQPWLGLTMSGIGAWQLRFDLARRTVRSRGLPRFAALGVLLGAAWLFCAGLLFTASPPPAGPVYDAALHSVFVGYVLSMVFAHAPIILPAVARVSVPFHPALYAPLAVLHLGLTARAAGDLLGQATLRSTGAIANTAALALFALTIGFARWRGASD